MHYSSGNVKAWLRNGLDFLAAFIVVISFLCFVAVLLYLFVHALLHDRAMRFTVGFVLLMGWACWRVANAEIVGDDEIFTIGKNQK